MATPLDEHAAHDLPDLRVVRRRDGTADLYINGAEFPHPISGDPGILIDLRHGHLPMVTITLLGDTLTVEDNLHDPEPAESVDGG